MSGNSVGHFFDALTEDYTRTIERCFPRYREMLWALLDYLPQDRNVESVLELGCGTGNFSVLLRTAFPTARLRLVDVSGESLDECRSRFGSEDGITLEQEDFRNLTYDDESFDLVLSSIAIHHLVAADKQELFRNVHRWLRRDGVFSFADQCAGASDDLNLRHIENWKSLTIEAGSTDDEWEMWMQHQAEHDHHDTLIQQLDWLREAGFGVVDCPWRYLLWAVVQARSGRDHS